MLQQARAEQEEEFISNTLLKKIQLLKKEKESLAMNYEQEEEFLTNDLSRKLLQVSLYRNSVITHHPLYVDNLANKYIFITLFCSSKTIMATVDPVLFELYISFVMNYLSSMMG